MNEKGGGGQGLASKELSLAQGLRKSGVKGWGCPRGGSWSSQGLQGNRRGDVRGGRGPAQKQMGGAGLQAQALGLPEQKPGVRRDSIQTVPAGRATPCSSPPHPHTLENNKLGWVGGLSFLSKGLLGGPSQAVKASPPAIASEAAPAACGNGDGSEGRGHRGPPIGTFFF